MVRSWRPLLTMMLLATAVLPQAVFGGEPTEKVQTASVLTREAVVPLVAVTRYFPGLTVESTGPNDTTVGDAAGSISVVFTDADLTKKVTLSVDEYRNAEAARSAFSVAVRASEVAPGFKLSDAPPVGEEAFAGTSQVGEERHYGLGARKGRLIVSATHAGGIPVTPENSENMIALARATLAAAEQVLGP
jgi:hypothetical protein